MAVNNNQTQTHSNHDQTRSWYDTLSSIYDTLALSSERSNIDKGLNLLNVQKAERVAEIGSGTGYALQTLAKSSGPSGLVVGLDISSGMVKIAREKIIKMDTTGRAVILQGDGSTLPYRSATFNAVFASFTVELFERQDIPIVLKECLRILMPGGRICIVALSRDDKLGLVGRFYQWLHRLFPKQIDCRPIPIQRYLKESGFSQVKVEKAFMWGLPVGIVLAKRD